MSIKLKLSIITVCYNSATTIENTLISVNKQTVDDWEHILVDGGSTDNTLKLIGQYHSKKRVVISEPDNGIYDAMNKGCKYARGEYIIFLNSDDEFYDNRTLEKVIPLFEKSPDIVFCATKLFDLKRKRQFIWNAASPSARPVLYKQNPHPSTIVRASFLKKHSYTFPSKFPMVADLHQQLMLIYKFEAQVFVSNIIVTSMAIGGASTSNRMMIIRNSIEAYNIYGDIFGRHALLFAINRLLRKFKRILYLRR